ncbi:MAG: phage tail protein [Exiguobacterium sp.]|nr:phage tail protein [Exiguobacterium sp.]
MDTIYRYAPNGQSLGIVRYDTATHEEDLDGTDKLTVKCRQFVQECDRLIWQDNGGHWREHIVDQVDTDHKGGVPVYTLTCSNSLNELYGKIANGTELSGSVKSILASLVSGTRWSVGGCSNFGRIDKIEVWHRNVRECITDLQKACGGELATVIEANEHGVTARYVRILAERGNKTAKRQFTYGRNMSHVQRHVSGQVYTQVIGYGAKLNDDSTDDYSERLSVVESNSDGMQRWGIPDASGNMTHSTLIYNDEACTSSDFLRRQVKKLLRKHRKPNVTYELDLDQIGDDGWGGMQLGTVVLVRDEGFSPPLELRERVTHITRRMGGRMKCRIVVGDRKDNELTVKFKAVEKVARQSSGNNARTYSETPLNTSGDNSYTGGSYGSTGGSGGSGGSGDSVRHYIDGTLMSDGEIRFTTFDAE